MAKRVFTLNEPSIRISPSLAEEIGFNESIVLLQIEYWISISENLIDGRKWTYQSVRTMQDKVFAFWSASTINRTIKNLLDKGYIIEGNYNKHRYDKTRWFALNYERLAELKSIAVVGSDGDDSNTSSQNDTGSNENSGGDETGTTQNDTGVEESIRQNDTRSNQNDTRSNQNDTTIPKTTTKTTTNYSADAKSVANHLKSILKSKGITLPKNWHLKSYAVAESLIKNIPKDEIIGCINWATNDSYWSQQVDSMSTIERLLPKYQLQNQKPREQQQQYPYGAKTEDIFPPELLAAFNKNYKGYD